MTENKKAKGDSCHIGSDLKDMTEGVRTGEAQQLVKLLGKSCSPSGKMSRMQLGWRVEVFFSEGDGPFTNTIKKLQTQKSGYENYSHMASLASIQNSDRSRSETEPEQFKDNGW